MGNKGWVGVDLDQTLAKYMKWTSVDDIGEPIPEMVKIVKRHLDDGDDVRIFTARVCTMNEPHFVARSHEAIRDWTRKHLGVALEATAEKDFELRVFYDDRAIGVVPNKGQLVGDQAYLGFVSDDGRPRWDGIWASFAQNISRRSTCARAKVGCVIVDDDNTRVIAIGYNGGPRNGPNECLSEEPGKCGHLHAEINALIKGDNHATLFQTMYVTVAPCYNCAVAIVNYGSIREVVYEDDYRDRSGIDLLSSSGITVRNLSEKL